jgi:hypothetical protein
MPMLLKRTISNALALNAKERARSVINKMLFSILLKSNRKAIEKQ